MKTRPINVGSNIAHNGHRIFPASGTPDEAQMPHARFRNAAHHDPKPASELFSEQDVLLFEDGTTLIYDDVDNFVTHAEWVKANSSRESARSYFASFKATAA